MKALGELKQERESQISKLLSECGVFFAFSNEQFAANKTALKEGEKYVHAGMGTYLPKGNLDKYLDGLATIRKDYNQAVKENKQRKANILYELNNYEAFYTGDLEDTIEALGSDYTEEEVRTVYNENKN